MRISNTFIIALITLATAACFTFSACHKQKAEDTEDTGYASDHASLEKTFSDALSIADQAGTSGSLSTYRTSATDNVMGACATVTNDTTLTPHKLTIDFGTANCLSKDGNYRRGKIIVEYTGKYRDLGHSHTISFDNYFVNDNQVTGTKTVTYSSNTASGNPKYDITVNGQIILANSAGTISWNSTRTRTWLAGFNTPTWTDDEYEITGSGTITRASGKTFSVQIITPLHVALACKWIESGVVDITPQGGTARTLNYGNGTCDAQADFTVNGKTYSITLK